MAWTSPRTWLAGEKPSASTYNTHIRDNFKAIGDAWTSYSPTWAIDSGGTNPSIGNGSLTGRYMQAGKLVMFTITLVAGSTTTWGSGVYTWTYPVTPLNSTANTGSGIYGYFWDNDNSKPYPGIGVGFSSTRFRVSTTYTNSFFSQATPVAGANGDKIILSGMYEAA